MFTGVKVFSATKAKEREELGENVFEVQGEAPAEAAGVPTG